MTRSWVYGAATVLGVHVVWLALILTQARADWVMGGIIIMFFLTMNIAGVGAFITARLAPRHRFLMGLTMAPLAAVLAVGGNLLLAATGTHVDFSGFRGNLGLFAVSLAYGLFVSSVCGGIGVWRARRRDAAAPITEVPPTALPQSPTPAADPASPS